MLRSRSSKGAKALAELVADGYRVVRVVLSGYVVAKDMGSDDGTSREFKTVVEKIDLGEVVKPGDALEAMALRRDGWKVEAP